MQRETISSLYLPYQCTVPARKQQNKIFYPVLTDCWSTLLFSTKNIDLGKQGLTPLKGTLVMMKWGSFHCSMCLYNQIIIGRSHRFYLLYHHKPAAIVDSQWSHLWARMPFSDMCRPNDFGNLLSKSCQTLV